MSGSNRLPYGTLALGAEGIKDAINGFDDACVILSFVFYLPPIMRKPASRRKSDIENERLPPDLVDADSAEGKAFVAQPGSPVEEAPVGLAPNGMGVILEGVATGTSTSPATSASSSAPATPMSPVSSTPSSLPFRRGHGRQASLGTTMTSPSTRRRSIESTLSLIQDAWGNDKKPASEVSELTEQLSSTNVATPAPPRRG
jgi:serine/threonine-protein phosphatase 2B catalytic subunit